MHEDKDYQKLSRNELVALIAESRKESENLRASLDELNRQTRDIRHRIKNIFQIVTSLLNLQERSIDSGNCSAAFSKSRFRIQMMSVMYEYVYGAPFAKSVKKHKPLPAALTSLSTPTPLPCNSFPKEPLNKSMF